MRETHLKSSIALACLLWSLSAFTVAADTESKTSIGASTVPNSGDTDLRALLREVGTRLHKHFVVDPRLPQTIDLGGLDHRDVTYPQLLSILEVYGMVAVAYDGITQVIPITDARQAATPIVPPDNIKELDGEWVTSVVLVKNVSAAQLVPILRPLIPQAGHLAAFPITNALIISDRSGNVRRIIELIKILESLPKVAEPPPQKPSP
jgi:general secretion pathway protein D